MAQLAAGVAFKYGAMGAGGTKPTEWTHIPGITEIPEIGGDVETIETTSLDNLEYKTYINGLKDTGGSIGMTANDTREFREAWDAFVEASKTENGAWAAITIPAPLNKRMVFKADAAPLGFGGAAVNAVLTTTAYVTPMSEPQWSDVTA